MVFFFAFFFCQTSGLVVESSQSRHPIDPPCSPVSLARPSTPPPPPTPLPHSSNPLALQYGSYAFNRFSLSHPATFLQIQGHSKCKFQGCFLILISLALRNPFGCRSTGDKGGVVVWRGWWWWWCGWERGRGYERGGGGGEGRKERRKAD